MVQIAVLFDARAEWLCRAARVFVVGECDVSSQREGLSAVRKGSEAGVAQVFGLRVSIFTTQAAASRAAGHLSQAASNSITRNDDSRRDWSAGGER